ncbi:Ferrous iron transport periplasmic protein EfeO [Candidatus Liberibacter solanacearum]|uniref:Ferrous iron transport periplasmic protein EfeO n=2 Tax=Candidatus Liberibacter solanacearum TaxID=556287 RepID=A0A0F4VL70_9HYPH|nr:Ferrous iron transport periplasmic protein EfeO [Candidatus Liberibacter solanacearum]
MIIAKGDIPTAEKYRPAMKSYVDFILSESIEMISNLEIVNKKLQIGELEAAQQAYIQSYYHYESIRPIVISFGNIDRIIDARADYFRDGVKDRLFTGFHFIEYHLFNHQDIKAALDATDQLLIQLRDLKKRISIHNFTILDMVRAASDFIEMILKNKINGKENIYSFSDLSNIASNVRGSQELVTRLSSFISEKVLLPISQNYRNINEILSHYKLMQGGYRPYFQLRFTDKMVLYSILSQQAECLAILRAQLNIDVYH